MQIAKKTAHWRILVRHSVSLWFLDVLFSSAMRCSHTSRVWFQDPQSSLYSDGQIDHNFCTSFLSRCRQISVKIGIHIMSFFFWILHSKQDIIFFISFWWRNWITRWLILTSQHFRVILGDSHLSQQHVFVLVSYRYSKTTFLCQCVSMGGRMKEFLWDFVFGVWVPRRTYIILFWFLSAWLRFRNMGHDRDDIYIIILRKKGKKQIYHPGLY